MRTCIRILHLMMLLPVVLLVSMVLILRVGVSSHALFHNDAELLISDLIQEEIRFGELFLELTGSQLYITNHEVHLGTSQFHWESMSFSVNLMSFLEDSKPRISNISITGIDLSLQESQGNWNIAESSNNSDLDLPSLLASSLQFGVNQIEVRNSKIRLQRELGAELQLEHIDLTLFLDDDGSVVIRARASMLQPPDARNENEIALDAIVTLDGQGGINTLDVKAKAHELPLPMPQIADFFDVDIAMPSLRSVVLSTNLVFQYDQEATRVRLQETKLKGYSAEVPISLEANVGIDATADAIVWDVNSAVGSISGAALPVADMLGKSSPTGLFITSNELTLGDVTRLVRALRSDVAVGAIPDDAFDAITSLAPTGKLRKPSLLWRRDAPDNFVFQGAMADVNVAAWTGVPKVTDADGRIFITPDGGKVVIDDDSGIGIGLSEVTNTHWTFDAMQGAIAWRFVADSVYLDSNEVSLRDGDGRYLLTFGGQFDLNDDSADVQVEVKSLGVPIADINALMPDVFSIPQMVMDLSPQGDLAVTVSSSSKTNQDGTQGQSVNYAVSGDRLSGHFQDLDLPIEDVSLRLTGDELGLEDVVIDGQTRDQTVAITLVNEADLQEVLPQLPIEARLLAASRAPWFRFSGSLDGSFLPHLSQIANLGISDYLPKSLQAKLWIPMCLFEGDATCRLALGQAQALVPADTWPSFIDASLPLAWSWSHPVDSTFASLTLGNADQKVHAYLRDDTVVGMGVGLGLPAPQADTGTVVNGRFGNINVDTILSNGLALGQDALVPTDFVLPKLSELELYADSITWQGNTVTNVGIAYSVIEYEQADQSSRVEGWGLALDSDQVLGRITSIGENEPWNVDIQRLSFVDGDAETATKDDAQDMLAAVDPAQLPDMDVSIVELYSEKRSLGRWQGKLRVEDGIAYVHDLVGDTGDSLVEGNLTWAKTEGRHKTKFSGRASTNTLAKALSSWGYVPTLDSEDVNIEAHLSWNGSPVGFDVKTADGDISLIVKGGMLVETPDELKASKVIALLDFKRLLGILTLNLSNTISEGFSFDSITAQYNFRDGLAQTLAPAEFKSSAMDLMLVGNIDFNQRQVNKDLYVTLPLLEKLPFLAFLSGSIELSGTLYIVEKLLGNELSTFTSTRYSITGDLDYPEIELETVFDKNTAPKSLVDRAGNAIKVQ